jgi:hypothetical protein
MVAVFVSHRADDKADAELLARDIKSRGHAVWLDSWEIHPGDSIIEKIGEGLASADYVVVCFSVAGSSSPWMAREWMSTLARQLEGVGVKLIPVLLDGGVPPVLLADVRYVDLTRDWAAGVNRLCAVLR